MSQKIFVHSTDDAGTGISNGTEDSGLGNGTYQIYRNNAPTNSGSQVYYGKDKDGNTEPIVGSSSSGIASYQATATDDITTQSATDVVATGMTLTPPAGTYLVWFSGSAKVSIDTGTDFVYMSIYSGGSQVASSEQRNGTGDGTAGYNNAFNCVAKVTVNGLQSIEGRWRVGDALDTGTMHQRNITALLLVKS